MLTLRQCWDELVRQTKALDVFVDVRPYPFNRTTKAAFFEDLPALRLPACLIVLLGRDTAIEGAALYRTSHWGAVIVTQDVGGDAYLEQTCALVDAFEGTDEHAGVLDQQVLGGELTIKGSCEVRAVRTMPDLSVFQVSFETEEGVER